LICTKLHEEATFYERFKAIHAGLEWDTQEKNASIKAYLPDIGSKIEAAYLDERVKSPLFEKVYADCAMLASRYEPFFL